MERSNRVFVVEDDDAVRDSISLMLETAGFAVDAYASCERFLREAQVDGDSCLLLDVHMQDMNGLELLGRLDQYQIALPTIVMTGMPDTTIMRTVERFGATLLVKPFRSDELIACIERALNQKEFC